MIHEPTLKQRAKGYDATNKAAALIILEHPERYSGVCTEWAEAFLRRLELESVEPYPLLLKLALDAAERAA